MSKVKIKDKAKQLIDNLSVDRAKLILNLIEYLNEKEEWKVTEEILSDRGMMEDIKACDEAIKAGEEEQFVPWRKMKKANV